MAEYALHILPPALQELKGLDRAIGQRLIKKIRWLAVNVDALKPERLTGNLAGFYKLREGDYRIIYQRIEAKNIIVIHAVGHRRNIYKKPR